MSIEELEFKLSCDKNKSRKYVASTLFKLLSIYPIVTNTYLLSNLSQYRSFTLNRIGQVLRPYSKYFIINKYRKLNTYIVTYQLKEYK